MAQSTVSFTVVDLDSENSRAITDELGELDGVMGVETDADSGDVMVRYDEDVLAGERIEITTRELGYDIE
ncbi:heavy-metal-associated domain-containing protein [Halalkalicoccus subterraneus]|uniref:heavy-metal-associated domain-containing protein n=1 Tax=Halalkalicoccus subterraneus TaxID=2675002 RepID=UPI000EFA8A93|nr:copper-binding protein [Halalkalicoccus subterraneus]